MFIKYWICLQYSMILWSSFACSEDLSPETKIILNGTNILNNDSEAGDMLKYNITDVTINNDIMEGDAITSVEEMNNSLWGSTANTSEDIFSGLSNMTFHEISNKTIYNVTNITTEPFIKENDTGGSAVGPSIGTGESAAILAAVFLIVAAVSYGGMLTWRRFLNVRYGTSEMLITDDVYDISDLRNFEI